MARGWLRFGGAILFLFSAVVAGCSGSGPSASTGWSGGGPSPVSSSTPSVGAPAALPSPAAASDEAAFDAALAPLQGASAFETVVEIAGAPVLTATGRTVGPASQLTVTTGGRAVDHIQIPPDAWAREPGGSWVLIGAEGAPAAPIDVLADPLTLEAVSPTSFKATYSAASLGLEGNPVVVTISLDGPAVTFRYEATTGGRQTSSTTTLRPGSADPIVAPTP